MSTSTGATSPAGPADLALEIATAALPDGAEVALDVERLERGLTRFADSAIHQNVAEDAWTAVLTAHHEGRTVTVTAGLGGASDDGALRRLAERGAQSLALAPADPGWPGLAEPSPLPGAAAAAEPTSPADRADAVAAFVAGAGGLTTAGYVRSQRRATWFASSTGQRGAGASSSSALDGIARTGGADGVCRESALTLSELDPHAAGALAAAKARAGSRSGSDPVEIEPGRYEVLLEPAAAVDLVQSLALWGFNGRALVDGSTFVQLGQQQLDAAITLRDDPAPWGDTCDAEGTPKHPLTMVDAGRSAAVAHDRRTAAEAGTGSTGHATSSWPVPLHLGIAPGAGSGGPGSGGAGPAGHRDQVHGAALPLLAGVERGLLVSDFWYTRVLDPRQLTVTGLTRNGVWLVEDGEVVAPVQNVRFTQSYPQALAPGAVLAVGSVAVTTPDSWMPSAYSAPALRLASWNVTGNASG